MSSCLAGCDEPPLQSPILDLRVRLISKRVIVADGVFGSTDFDIGAGTPTVVLVDGRGVVIAIIEDATLIVVTVLVLHGGHGKGGRERELEMENRRIL